MSESKKYCSNCKRDVTESNFLMHTTHCHRYLEICSQCNEPVPKKEMDDHMEEFHADISCEKCGEDMQIWELESHKKKCVKRLEACQYCELSITMDDLNDHESQCGARTEACSRCKKYVMVKDKENHKYTCNKGSRQNVSASEVSIHPKMAERVRNWVESFHPMCPTCKKRFQMSEIDDHRKACELQETLCPICNEHFTMREIEIHVNNCANKMEKNAKAVQNGDNSRRNICASEVSVEEEIKCDSCDLPFKASVYENHQKLCVGRRFKEYRQRSSTSSSSENESSTIESSFSPSKHNIVQHNSDKSESDSDKRGTSNSHYRSPKAKTRTGYADDRLKPHLCTNCKKSVVTEPNELCSICNHSGTPKCKDLVGNLSIIRQEIGDLTITDDGSVGEKFDVVSEEEKLFSCSRCKDNFLPEAGESNTLCKSCQQVRTTVGRGYVIKKQLSQNYEFGRGKSSLQAHLGSACVRTTVGRGFVLEKPISQKYEFGRGKALRQDEAHFGSAGGRKREFEENRQSNTMHQSHGRNEVVAATANEHKKKNWANLLTHFLESDQHSPEVESFRPICPTCNKRFHMSEIDDHMKACELQDTPCPICNEHFSMKEIEIHVNICVNKSEKFAKAVEKNDLYVPHPENLSKSQKKKLLKKKKKDARNEANNYLANCNRSYSDIAKGTKVEVERPEPSIDALIPCEFCNECFHSSILIFHQSGCRPDLLHFPKQNCDRDEEESDEDGYAKARRSVRPKITSSQANDAKWSKQRDYINKEAAHQNYSNRARESNLSEDEQRENHYSKRKYQHSSRNVGNFSLTELHLGVTNNQSKASGSPLKCDDPDEMAVKEEFSHLMRGRGRARPTHTGPLPRPGEFLQRSQNVKLGQTKLTSLAELSRDLNKVTLNQADAPSASSMLPYVYEHRDNVLSKKLKSTPSGESNREKHSYKFDVLPEGSSVEELVNKVPWKNDYSRNLLNNKDQPLCDKASSAESKVNKMNILLNDVSADASNENSESDVSSSEKCMQEKVKTSSSSVDQHGASFKFTASPSAFKLLQKPYISRATRHIYQQQSNKPKIEPGNNENDDENVIDNPDNNKGSLLILTLRLLSRIACLSMSFCSLVILFLLLLLYCVSNHYDIFILIIALLS